MVLFTKQSRNNFISGTGPSKCILANARSMMQYCHACRAKKNLTHALFLIDLAYCQGLYSLFLLQCRFAQKHRRNERHKELQIADVECLQSIRSALER